MKLTASEFWNTMTSSSYRKTYVDLSEDDNRRAKHKVVIRAKLGARPVLRNFGAQDENKSREKSLPIGSRSEVMLSTKLKTIAIDEPKCEQQNADKCTALEGNGYVGFIGQSSSKRIVFTTDLIKPRGRAASRNLIYKEKPVLIIPQIPPPEIRGICIDCCRPILRNEEYAKCQNCFWPVCFSGCDDKVSLHTKEECDILTPLWRHKHWLKRSGYETVGILRGLLLKGLHPEAFNALMNWELCRGAVPLENEEIHIKTTLKMLRDIYDVSVIDYTDEEIIKIWNIIRLKSMWSLSSSKSIFKLAKMIFLDGSNIKQSCVPNCFFYIDQDFSLRLYLLKDINTGDDVTINYHPEHALLPTSERQIYLQEYVNKPCDCERCLDVTELGLMYSGLPCQASVTSIRGCTKRCQGFLLKDRSAQVWKCQKCGAGELTDTEVEKWLAGIYNGMEAVGKRKDPDALNTFVMEVIDNRILHETHFLTLQYFIETLKILQAEVMAVPTREMVRVLDKYELAARTVINSLKVLLPQTVLVSSVSRISVLVILRAQTRNLKSGCWNAEAIVAELEQWVFYRRKKTIYPRTRGPLLLKKNKFEMLESIVLQDFANSLMMQQLKQSCKQIPPNLAEYLEVIPTFIQEN